MNVAEQTWMDTHHKPDWKRRLARAQRRRSGAMAINKDLKVEVGDEFEDMDWRVEGRIVKVLDIVSLVRPAYAVVETIVPAKQSTGRFGHKTRIRMDRLRNSQLYRKVSR